MLFSDPQAQRRFIWSAAQNRVVPVQPSLELLRALWHEFRAPAQRLADETIYDFAVRRFGK